jgi:hypothetical protein
MTIWEGREPDTQFIACHCTDGYYCGCMGRAAEEGGEPVAVMPARQQGKTATGEIARSAAAAMAASIMSSREPGWLPTPPLPDGIPDRLCIEGNSRYHSPATPYIGVRINGSAEDSGDVVEYCVSGRWVRLGVRGTDGSINRVPGKLHDLETTRLDDVAVEVYWRIQPSRQVRRALARGK